MPRLIRFYIRHVLIGFGLSALFVGLLIWGDVAGLRHLILTSPQGALALFLLWLFNGIVLAGAQFGVAVMLMTDREEPPGGKPAPTPDLATAPVGRR